MDAPPPERLTALLENRNHEDATACLDALAQADPDSRKATLQALKTVADDQPATVAPVASAVEPFLTDAERSIRLVVAKLFVAVAEAEPAPLVEQVPALADRLADDEEFYYVRARSAEALGYLALEHPDAVGAPDILADLRIGLEFDEPEVKEKLAKALEHVALGDPTRLRHQVSALADSLDDETVLVRYHLTTALVVVGCAHPAAVRDGRDAFVGLLDDENAHVRGRAAEALGLLARSTADASIPDGTLSALADADESFVAERARFAVGTELQSQDRADEIGDIDAIRERTDAIATEIATPDTDGECPSCGLALPETGPPMCPRCGAPR